VKFLALVTALLLASPVLAATPAPPSTTLVLVVASNRGATLDRPPLQYADDDGAKYHEVFASLAGEANTTLLTEFDSDTARLFPKLAASVSSPTRAHVDAAVERFARQASEARRMGQHIGFYFVFAGHGDVDGGRGFLELSDGAFTADDLDALLRRIGADEAHVILDSCNSFFVLNPRKPGGRRFATPHDAAERLARQLPNVGVFLSTSAEAEVFEWSELQSGVFSHTVRSGLMGAADANHDGRVSYEELAAFVATAAVEKESTLPSQGVRTGTERRRPTNALRPGTISRRDRHRRSKSKSAARGARPRRLALARRPQGSGPGVGLETSRHVGWPHRSGAACRFRWRGGHGGSPLQSTRG